MRSERRVAMISTRWLPLALAGLALLSLAMLLLGTGDVDRSILLALYARDEPWLALGAKWLSDLGTWPTVVVVTVLGAVWLLYRGKRWAALTLLVASFSGRLLVILAKAYFARVRPEENLRLVEVHYQSFPSGHSANSMIAFLAIALLAFDDRSPRKWAVAAAVSLSVLIGLSRPMLGVHWPSDVVGGWAFGIFWTLIVLRVSSHLEARNGRG